MPGSDDDVQSMDPVENVTADTIEFVSGGGEPSASNRDSEKLAARVRDAWQKYQRDKAEHELFREKLLILLESVRTKKRKLLGILTKREGNSVEDAAFRVMALDQLVKKISVADELLRALRSTDKKEKIENSVTHTQTQSKSGRDLEREKQIMEKQFLFSRDKEMYERNRPLPSIWTQAMKVERVSEADFRVSWINRTEMPTEEIKQEIPITETVSETPSSVARITQLPVVSVHGGSERTNEETETNNFSDALAEALELDLSEERPTKQVEEKPVQGNTVERHQLSEIAPTPPVTPPPVQNTPTPEPLVIRNQPTVSFVRPPAPVPNQFEIPAIEPPPIKASTIAGGAAFGQSSFPRSCFSSPGGGVVPQLGSLQYPSPADSTGPFSSLMGGFSTFAQKGNAFDSAQQNQNSPQPQQSAFSGQGSTPSETSSIIGNIPSTDTRQSIFRKPAPAKDDKLWQMRK